MGDGREGGFIKLHRRLVSSPLWRSMSAEQRAVFIELLFLANWKPAQARWKDAWYEVKRGELSHTLATIAASANTSVKVVRTALKALMSDDRPAGGNGPAITERYPISGTGAGTGPRILTIVNYCRYQDVQDESGTGMGTAGAQQGHGSGTGGAQIEEGEEGEEGKNLLLSPPPAADGKAARKPKAKKDTDPRHPVFVERLASVFEAVRGAKYGFTPRDAKAVTEIIAFANGAPEEAERRWRIGLNEIGFRRSDSIHDLASKWNAYVGAAPAGAQKVTAAASSHSEFTGGRRAL